MKKIIKREHIVLWIALAALVCAAINLNASLNRLLEKDRKE